MLSRTADHLFWMARYMERAENTARMLDVTLKALLLPQSEESATRSQRAVLDISELGQAFSERYDALTPENVLRFMVTDADNPSSILRCLQAARENARAVRGAITTESWETINHTWLEFGNRLADNGWLQDPNALFEWVKFRSHLSRGVTPGHRAAGRRLLLHAAGHLPGTGRQHGADPGRSFRERRARNRHGQRRAAGRLLLLDVHPELGVGAGNLPPGLPRRARAGTRGGTADPESVHAAGRCWPRSTASVTNLAMLTTQNSMECERYAGKLRAELLFSDIRDVLDQGLHEYLTQFLARMYVLGNKISTTFLLPTTV